MIPPGMLNNLFGNSVKESAILSVLMISFRDIFVWLHILLINLGSTIKNKIRRVIILDFALIWIFSIFYFIYVRVPLYILGCVTSILYLLFEFLRQRSNLFSELSSRIATLEEQWDIMISKLLSCTFYDIYFCITELIGNVSISKPIYFLQ